MTLEKDNCDPMKAEEVVWSEIINRKIKCVDLNQKDPKEILH